MRTLLKENMRYLMRSRLIIVMFAFSFLTQYLGLKFLNQLTVSIQGTVSVIGPKQSMVAAMVLHFFSSLTIGTVYGIWLAPYAHRGQRSLLTHIIPVAKIQFPLSYLLSCGFLLLLNSFILVTTFVGVFGIEAFSSSVQWPLLFRVILLEILCVEAVMMGLALSSLALGQMTTFFLAGTSLFALPLLEAGSRLINPTSPSDSWSVGSLLFWILHQLPPLGALVFDLRLVLAGQWPSIKNLVLWTLWLLIFSAAFTWKIRYPLKTANSET